MRENRHSASTQFRTGLAALPGVGAALLPKLACTACWPAYAGLASSLGLGFVLETRWLLALTGVFLAVCVGALYLRARRDRKWGPCGVGLTACGVILVAKFIAEIDLLVYAGVAGLVLAFLWSLRTTPTDAGSVCEPSKEAI